ncbi:MAG: helix-turn-helix domain-containing protein [Oscillospiraceae bacterium]|uniref:helix-turn-helix domain-containing protein n=1 Tax=Porcipelethomonas sp. TaxID=2981675 RepID=UPI0030773EB5
MTKIPRLFELMKEHGISSKKLSDDTKISTGNISDWKSGRSQPSLDKIRILADYFNVSIDYLLDRTDNPDSHKK